MNLFLPIMPTINNRIFYEQVSGLNNVFRFVKSNLNNLNIY